MYFVLKLILAATVTGDFLLLCVAVLLLRIARRARPRETPPVKDAEALQRAKEAREDAEAWRRMMSYSVEDAYGTRGVGG